MSDVKIIDGSEYDRLTAALEELEELKPTLHKLETKVETLEEENEELKERLEEKQEEVTALESKVNSNELDARDALSYLDKAIDELNRIT